MTEGGSARSDLAADRGLTILCLAVAFQLATALLSTFATSFPGSFDELQHLSMIRWLEIHPAIFPHYDQAPTLSRDLTHWTARPNYLNHPSPYYLLLAGIDRLWPSVTVLRLANVALSTAAVAAMLWVGLGRLTGTGAKALFAAILVMFPKLGDFAGTINNDNAGMLAGAVLFWAMFRWRDGRGGWPMAIALAAAGWTKFTVLVMAALAFAILRARTPPLRPGREDCKAAAGLALGLIPTAVNLTRYGRPFFHTLHWYVDPAARTPMTALQFAGHFLWRMVIKWPALDGATGLEPIALALLLAAAVAVCVVGWKRWPVASAMILAIAPAIALHLWFGWRSFVEDGYADAAETRYYYPLWPGVALGAALLWARYRGPAARMGAALALTSLFTCSFLFAGALALALGKAIR